MLMPEAAMHEDREPVAGQDYVRLAGQIAAMQPEAEPSRVKETPDGYFGLCI